MPLLFRRVLLLSLLVSLPVAFGSPRLARADRAAEPTGVQALPTVSTTTTAAPTEIAARIEPVQATEPAVDAAPAADTAGETTSIRLVDPIIDTAAGRISGSTPFAECTDDSVEQQPGAVFLGSEVEPFVAAHPTDGQRLVATWQQDRWSNGGGRGIGTAASDDGGRTWTTSVLPGLTPCTGGAFDRASDPWVSIGPDGIAHHVSLAVSAPFEGLPRRSALLSHRSLDGGLTWEEPVVILDETSSLVFNDKPTITANPLDEDAVYVVWTRSGRFTGARRPIMIASSDDGGITWPHVSEAFDPGLGKGALGAQLVVEPSGSLRLFTSVIGEMTTLDTIEGSSDGRTWAPDSEQIAEIQASGTRDPDDGSTPFRAGEQLADVAIDPVSGAMYATWQDARFGEGRIDSIVFSMSSDGKEWTEPVRVDDVPQPEDRPLDGQAFTPSVAVAPDGTVGIGWYDMRTNVAANLGVPTEYRLRVCRPNAESLGCALAAGWGEPLVLTDAPFDVTTTPISRGRFLGDYVGLTGSADGFVAVVTVTHDEDPSSQLARRVVLQGLPIEGEAPAPPSPSIPPIPVRPEAAP